MQTFKLLYYHTCGVGVARAMQDEAGMLSQERHTKKR